MNDMTCQDVQAQLDLLAADECDPVLRPAIDAHLQQCTACTASYAESRRMLAMLSLHWDAAGPLRLRQRLNQEAQRSRRRQGVLPFVRRAMAVAALLIVSAGLLFVLPKRAADTGGLELALAVQEGAKDARGSPQAPGPGSDNQAAFKSMKEAVELASVPDQMGEKFRRDLREGQRERRPPPTPELELKLELKVKNSGPRPVTVRIGDAGGGLSLDVEGDGVVRLPAPGAQPPPFLQLQTIRLAPGDVFRLPINHLIAGDHLNLEYIYLTEPGEYVLHASMRLSVGGEVRTVTNAVRIKVANSK